jgi:hypothetical protein
VKWISTGGDAEPGLLAFGDQPVGIVAIGQMPTGVIAIGTMARGFVAIGFLALGAIAFACGIGGGGRAYVCGVGGGGVVWNVGLGVGLRVNGDEMLLADYEPTAWWWIKAIVLCGALAALVGLVWSAWPETLPVTTSDAE